MIIYQKNNFAFQHINRTGGTSVKRMLRGIAGDPDKGSLWGKIEHRPLDVRLKRIREQFSNIDIDNIPIYVNVRNPFDRIVSIFAYRRKRGKYFKVYFKNFFYNMYMKTARAVNDAEEAFCCVDGVKPENVRVVKFEDINHEWPRIVSEHFGPQIDIWPKMNSSLHDEPMSYFNKRMIDEVLQKEKWVIENYYPYLLEL